MNHVMIDIETLGTSADAVVLSIGAVRFAPRPLSEPQPYEEFYQVLRVEDQLENGRTINHDTFKWWMRQGKVGRMAIAGENVHALYAATVMGELNNFTPDDVAGVWGNGSDFDNAILQHLNGQFGLPPLWPFWTNRCFRTFTNLFDPRKELRPQANNHHALDDCWNQIYWMQNICAEHGVEV